MIGFLNAFREIMSDACKDMMAHIRSRALGALVALWTMAMVVVSQVEHQPQTIGSQILIGIMALISLVWTLAVIRPQIFIRPSEE